MTRPARLDLELVRRGLASSRAAAQQAIAAGGVTVRGMPAVRPSTMVSPADPIAITPEARRFVSRGGEKLDGALGQLRVEVAGRRWMDAGASTGGFTDCLLQRGAQAVAAVDVGYGQLDWSLRNDDRVVVIERRNVRTMNRDDLPWVPDAVVADLSFVSLAAVMPALAAIASESADFVLLVKPQFEVGRDSVGRSGVVRDPELWRGALNAVVNAARSSELALAACVVSPLKGPAGNIEFFCHFRRGAPEGLAALDIAIADAKVLP